MIETYVKIALTVKLSTVYGLNEYNCGDIGEPRPCSYGAITASGVKFDPSKPQAAVFAPTNVRIRPHFIWLRVKNHTCVRIHLVDKGNPRYIGKRAFDLTPAAVKLLTGKEATPYWSGTVYPCKQEPRDPLWESPINLRRIK